MTVRLASASMDRPLKPDSKRSEDDPRQIYQEALKLLQDPILPVRAHGLLLLRRLVSSQAEKAPLIEPALIPGILSIFLQSLQEDDSYIFLNSVQGLSAMVDTFGKDVLTGLVDLYAGGLGGVGGSNITRQEVDTRIRIGEALGQVIRRCGGALSIYGEESFHSNTMPSSCLQHSVDILMPPLFSIVRSSHIPTILRTSALSLLADCEKTCPVALLHYVSEWIEGMIDLLQVESRPSALSREQDDSNEEMDLNPSSTVSKLPPLRRAAIHFLALVFREVTTQIYDDIEAFPGVFRPGVMARARTTLSYIASTDEDAVVRLMAREAVELSDGVGKALVGT